MQRDASSNQDLAERRRKRLPKAESRFLKKKSTAASVVAADLSPSQGEKKLTLTSLMVTSMRVPSLSAASMSDVIDDSAPSKPGMLSLGKRKLVVEACSGRGRRCSPWFRAPAILRVMRRAGSSACCCCCVAGRSAVAGVELVEAMLASAAGAARAREWRIYVKERGGDGKEKNVDDARSEPALLCQTSFSIDGKRKAEAREQT